MENIISMVVGVVVLIASSVVTAYLVPWLKNRNLIGVVKTLVEAAEKLSENQPLDKKKWVITQLEFLGVRITPFVDAAIESAVKQLDIAIGADFVAAVAGVKPDAEE